MSTPSSLSVDVHNETMSTEIASVITTDARDISANATAPNFFNTTEPSAINVTDFVDPLFETKEIIFTVQYVLLPFFLVTGMIGNSLTIVTMASRHFSHMTSRYILIFLAISDTVLLLTQPFNKLWVITLFGKDLRAISDTSCKAFFVIFKSAKMTSSWLVVLLCFERFVAVVFPLKAKTILRKRVIFPAIAVDYLFMLIYNSVWSFSSQVVGGVCKPDVPSLKHRIFVTIGSSFYSFIPTFLLMIFTPQIIYKLIKQMKIRRSLSNGSAYAKDSKRDDEMIRASFMVLGVMIAYIVLIIPITLVHIIAYVKGVSAFDDTSFSFFLFREIAQILEQINYAVNFFFYVLCSTTFRRRVLEILCLKSLGRGPVKTSSVNSKPQPPMPATISSALTADE